VSIVSTDSFTILESNIKHNVVKTFSKSYHSRQNYLPCYSDPGALELYRVKYPTKYRHIRALSIACWFFPSEVLGWKILFDLQEKFKYFSLDLESGGIDLTIELRLILDSKESMLNYLACLNTNQLFGNILRQDLLEALNELKLIRRSTKVQRKVRRRGYNDKGSRRDDSKWLENHDYSFTESQNYKELLQQRIELLLILKRRIFASTS
jgi:hypothetical protein